MAINFPDNPTSNQIYSEVNKSWKWNGTAWVGIASTGPQGEPGPERRYRPSRLCRRNRRYSRDSDVGRCKLQL